MGIIILFSGLVNGAGYGKGWLGMVYAGLTYSYFAVLISSIPTLILGIPAGLLAKKHNALNPTVILIGATVLGSLFLSLGAALYSSPFDVDLFWWAMIIGALGGLFNGYVFLTRFKPNKSLKNGTREELRAP